MCACALVYFVLTRELTAIKITEEQPPAIKTMSQGFVVMVSHDVCAVSVDGVLSDLCLPFKKGLKLELRIRIEKSG